MLYEIFSGIFSMGVTASVAILAVLAVRGMMYRLPKKYLYLLWVIVGVRLVFPVAVSSPFSVFNLVRQNGDSVFLTTEDMGNQGIETDTVGNHRQGEAVSGLERPAALPSQEDNRWEETKDGDTRMPIVGDVPLAEGVQGKPVIPLMKYASVVWLAGMAGILLWNIFAVFRMKKSLRTAVQYRDGIYECDGIPSPFVLGIIRPRIYIPFRLDEEERVYILKHEQYHIKRRDYLVKLMGCLLTCIYWFHPLVWLSYFLMARDMEMSCDEYVLQSMPDDIRVSYSKSLLGFAVNQRGMAVGMLAFGETDTRRRVKNVLRFKKPGRWIGVAAVALVAVAGAVCLTNAQEDRDSASKKVAVEDEAVKDQTDAEGELGDGTDKREESDETTFSSQEIKSAKACVEKYFEKHFEGCEIKRLWYDEERYHSQSAHWLEIYPEDSVMILYSDFYVSETGGDGSMERDCTYTDFCWILTKNEKTGWKVQTYGY